MESGAASVSASGKESFYRVSRQGLQRPAEESTPGLAEAITDNSRFIYFLTGIRKWFALFGEESDLSLPNP